jgi:argininosuccinate lyase
VAMNKDLSELSLEQLQRYNAAIDASVFDVLTLEGSVNARNITGGTAPAQVRMQIARWQTLLK